MNAVTTLVLVVTLLLALAAAGGATTDKAGVSSATAPEVSPSRLAANHNETLVRDTAPLR